MAELTTAAKDTRTNREVITQWKKIQEIKRSLLKEGEISGDATPGMVIAKVREQIPVDLLIV